MSTDFAHPTSAVQPKTAKGRATYDRILSSAAALIYERGVAGTSMDDVCMATSTSKSQLYHYFSDKSALVCAVIEWQRQTVLRGQQPYLGQFATMAELHAWRDHLVRANRALVSFRGCPIGSVASEVASTDDRARTASTSALEAWRQALADGLRRIVASGELPADCDPDSIALGLLAAVQGGELLAQTQQDARPLEIALDHALAAVDTLVVR